MLLSILIIQTVALLLIAVLATKGMLRGPAGPQGIQGISGGPAPAAVAPAERRDIAQILVKRGNEWHHFGHAQMDSEAYHDALKRSGWAVRPYGAAIDFGDQ